MVAPVTRAQMAKIWAAAREIGMDRETLYLLVPRGSIRNLSREEASELIEQLCGGPGSSAEDTRTRYHDRPRTPPGRYVTAGQRRLIAALFHRLGWDADPRRMRGFLRKYAHVERIDDLRDRKRAIAIIEALKAIAGRREHSRVANN